MFAKKKIKSKKARWSIVYDIDQTMIIEYGKYSLREIWGFCCYKMAWGENNLMKGIIVDDVHLQHYIYNAGGERIVKSTGGVEQVNVEGETIYDEAYLNSTTVYPNGFITVSPSGRYTKHYYVRSEGIMSRLMGSINVGEGGDDGSASTRQLGDLITLSSKLGLPNIELLAYDTEPDVCTDYIVAVKHTSSAYANTTQKIVRVM